MNAQRAVVESYKLLERLDGRGSVERARNMARAAGATFTNQQASGWLKKFVDRADGGADGPGVGSRKRSFGRNDGRRIKHETDGASDRPSDGETPSADGRGDGLTRGYGTPDTSPDAPKTTRSSSPSGTQISPSSSLTVSDGANAPHFGDAEPDVVDFLAVVAAENKTGKITPGRSRTLRRDLAVLRDRCSPDAFVYGLRQSISRGAGNVNYVATCAKSFEKRTAGGDAAPQLQLVDGGLRIPKGLTSAQEAVFREFARPGEDLDALSGRLNRENFDAFARLHNLPRTRQPELIAQ
jgi:hypothetical protein